MPKAALLSDDEIAVALHGLDGWRVAGTCLVRQYRFASFGTAFSFMAQIAVEAERLNHHPDWLNSYNKLDVSLTTHSSGGITGLDLELARVMDRAAALAV